VILTLEKRRQQKRTVSSGIRLERVIAQRLQQEEDIKRRLATITLLIKE